jgi:hypothetical protein
MANKIRVVIPAYRIAEKIKGCGEIEKYVNQHIELIEADMENALENEEPFSITELDTTFNVPYMNNKQAQREVYFHTAQALVKAGYRPQLKFLGKLAQTQRVFLVLRWKAKEEKQIDDYKDEFLRQITIGDDDTRRFVVPEKPKIPRAQVGRVPRPNPSKF